MPLRRSTSLLGQACQHLWLVGLDGGYQQFTSVSHTIHPSSPTALMLAVPTQPHGVVFPLAGQGYIVPRAFPPLDCSNRRSW